MNVKYLRYLGFLGLLGLLGLVFDNYGLFGFFGFFGLLGLSHIKSDELFEKNLAIAGLYAFIVSLICLSILMVLVVTIGSLEVAAIGVAITFVLQVLTFTFSFNIIEKRGEQ
ncbi:hypothetical protein SYNTR_2067 [Candidatus Syntrophocurvum alkaliphilum]|uniref:DUF3796 domain-containing protein n=1 Tax=Candidatus Syntrophocurvum alkaliphilum TaxID=2293317 RepID=A0A6I6DNG7_9FIRM|nr:DUF3796 domain-containing protein [Candidatus Syntrophocurvum alkaliphilum]QGU00661.1 hypothetical protein SYNTR_2067 [Candidatus Syntrophocurvum alkaliphilum]